MIRMSSTALMRSVRHSFRDATTSRCTVARPHPSEEAISRNDNPRKSISAT